MRSGLFPLILATLASASHGYLSPGDSLLSEGLETPPKTGRTCVSAIDNVSEIHEIARTWERPDKRHFVVKNREACTSGLGGRFVSQVRKKNSMGFTRTRTCCAVDFGRPENDEKTTHGENDEETHGENGGENGGKPLCLSREGHRETSRIACDSASGVVVRGARVLDRQVCCRVPLCSKLPKTEWVGAKHICRDRGGKVIPGYNPKLDTFFNGGLCCSFDSRESCAGKEGHFETHVNACRAARGERVSGLITSSASKVCCRVPLCSKLPKTEWVGAEHICRDRGGKVIPGYHPKLDTFFNGGLCCSFEASESCDAKEGHRELGVIACNSSGGVPVRGLGLATSDPSNVCCKVRDCAETPNHEPEGRLRCQARNGDPAPGFVPHRRDPHSSGGECCARPAERCLGSRLGHELSSIACSRFSGIPVRRWLSRDGASRGSTVCCAVPRCGDVEGSGGNAGSAGSAVVGASEVVSPADCRAGGGEIVSGIVPDRAVRRGEVCCRHSDPRTRCDASEGHISLPRGDCARFRGVVDDSLTTPHPDLVCCRVPRCASMPRDGPRFKDVRITTLRKCEARGLVQIPGWVSQEPKKTHAVVALFKLALALRSPLIRRFMQAHARRRAEDLREGLVCCGFDTVARPQTPCPVSQGEHLETGPKECAMAGGVVENGHLYSVSGVGPGGVRRAGVTACCRVRRCEGEWISPISCERRGGAVVPGWGPALARFSNGGRCCVFHGSGVAGSRGACLEEEGGGGAVDGLAGPRMEVGRIACGSAGGRILEGFTISREGDGKVCCAVEECESRDGQYWAKGTADCEDDGGVVVPGFHRKLETFFNTGVCCRRRRSG